jgi:hypothetical protein
VASNEQRIERVTRLATMSLLLFGSLHALALAAFFWQALQPWNLRVAVATGTCLLAYLAAWLVWRTAGVAALVVGLLAVVGSLARVLLPPDWTVTTAVTIALTLLFVVPIVHAIAVVARSTR